MKLSLYRLSGGIAGACVVGAEITGGNRLATMGPAKRLHVRVEGRPADVARFVPLARYAIRKMSLTDAREYLPRAARDWAQWVERRRVGMARA